MGPEDSGGVHTNSNIHNKAAYNVLNTTDETEHVRCSCATRRRCATSCLVRAPPRATFREARQVGLRRHQTYFAATADVTRPQDAPRSGPYAQMQIETSWMSKRRSINYRCCCFATEALGRTSVRRSGRRSPRCDDVFGRREPLDVTRRSRRRAGSGPSSRGTTSPASCPSSSSRTHVVSDADEIERLWRESVRDAGVYDQRVLGEVGRRAREAGGDDRARHRRRADTTARLALHHLGHLPLGCVVSLAPLDPRYWGERMPHDERVGTIKRRARAAMLAIVGALVGLQRCANDRCYLFADINSVLQLDEMTHLGPEHEVEALAFRGFVDELRPRTRKRSSAWSPSSRERSLRARLVRRLERRGGSPYGEGRQRVPASLQLAVSRDHARTVAARPRPDRRISSRSAPTSTYSPTASQA